jgi:hypothetical protein
LTSIEDVMTSRDRESLLKIIRQRERVAKMAASARSAHLLAEFEAQLDRQYSFDEDEVWRVAAAEATAVLAEAQRKIAIRCKELGIPPQFAPSLNVHWYDRGRNAAKAERAEMRRVAMRRIEEIEARAKADIAAASLRAQEEMMLGGLTTDAARKCIETLPSVEQLMPNLDLLQVQAMLASPRALAGQSRQHLIGDMASSLDDVDK